MRPTQRLYGRSPPALDHVECCGLSFRCSSADELREIGNTIDSGVYSTSQLCMWEMKRLAIEFLCSSLAGFRCQILTMSFVSGDFP